MWESIIEIFSSGDIWTIIIKVLMTASFTAIIGFLGTLTGKLILKNKESKIYKYASKCVRAAEMKFPNEGKKMGPEKMQYVMDQLAIKFPKIKENTYLYNIAEAAVYELNKENEKQAAVEEFKEKYGEDPLCFQNNDIEESTKEEIKTNSNVELKNSDRSSTPQSKQVSKLTSF